MEEITNWVQRAEKANAKRNIVAHHGVRVSGDTITLHSDQLVKIIDSLDTSDGVIKQGKAKGLADIREWIDKAKEAYEEGVTVIANLNRVRETSLAVQAQQA